MGSAPFGIKPGVYEYGGTLLAPKSLCSSCRNLGTVTRTRRGIKEKFRLRCVPEGREWEHVGPESLEPPEWCPGHEPLREGSVSLRRG